jgi:hypothetical protein
MNGVNEGRKNVGKMVWLGERDGLLYILELTLFGMKQLTEKKIYGNVVDKHVNICVEGRGGATLPPDAAPPSHSFFLHF